MTFIDLGPAGEGKDEELLDEEVVEEVPFGPGIGGTLPQILARGGLTDSERGPRARQPAGALGARLPDVDEDLAIQHATWQLATTGYYDIDRSRAFVRLTHNDWTPEIRSLALRNFTVAVGFIEAKHGHLDPGMWSRSTMPTLPDKLLALSDEQLADIEAKMVSADILLRQQETHDFVLKNLTMVYDALPAEIVERETGRQGFEPMDLGAARRQEERALIEAGGDPLNAGRLLDSLTGKEIRWYASDARLVAAVDTGGEPAIFDIDLDGPIGDTHLDFLVALTEAVYGTRHRIRSADQVPGGQTAIGKAAQTLGVFVNPVFRHKDKIDAPLNFILDPLTEILEHAPITGDPSAPWDLPFRPESFRTSQTIVNQRAAAASAELKAQIDVRPEDIIIRTAAAISPEWGPVQAAGISLGWWDTRTAAERASLLEAGAETEAEIIEAHLKDLTDDRHSAERFRDNLSAGLFDALSLYERFVQGNVVSALDFVGDLAEGVTRIPSEGLFGFAQAFDWEEGSAAFRGDIAVFDWLGQYVELDDSWRGVINVVGSLAGDPLTWIGASAVVRSRHTQRLLATRAGAVEWTQLPNNDWVWAVLKRAQKSDNASPIVMDLVSGTGISNKGIQEIIAGAPAREVFIREMADGTMIPTIGAHMKLRNQNQHLRRLLSIRDPKLDSYFTRLFSQWSSDRAISLAPDQVLDDIASLLAARGTSARWAADPALYKGALDDVLALTAPDGRAAQEIIALQADQVNQARAALLAEGRASGHRQVLNQQRRVTRQADRVTRMEAEAQALRTGRSNVDALDAAVARTEAAYLKKQTFDSSLAYQDALAARAGVDNPAARLAQIDETLDLIRNGEARLAAARAAGVDAADDLARITEAGGFIPSNFDEAVEAASEWWKRVQASTTERNKLWALSKRVTEPGGRPQALQEWLDGFMDDWATDVGLPRNASGEPIWAEITGGRAKGALDDMAEAIALQDPELAAFLRESGALQPAGVKILPVTPQEMVAYEIRKDLFGRALVPNPARGKTILSKSLGYAKQAWLVNVLGNLNTIVRSFGDPALRDIMLNGFRQALPRIARAGSTMPPFNLVRRALGLGAEPVLDDAANIFSRSMQRPWHTTDEAIQWVSPTKSAAKSMKDNLGLEGFASKGEFFNAAQQLFDGTLPSRPGIKAWAQSVFGGDDMGQLIRWWEQEGGRLLAPPVAGRAEALTVTEFAKGIESLIDIYAVQVAPAMRAAWKEAVIKSWATGTPVPPSMLRQVKVVPTVNPPSSSFVSNFFEAGFGRPNRVHTALLAKQYRDDTYAILRQRHGDRILTAEKVAEFLDTSLDEARMILARGGDEVGDLLRTHGMFTERQLDMQARRTARRHADHLSYQMAGQTLAGQRLGQVYPFLKAQTDFYAFYGRELMSGTALGLNPILAKGIRKLGGGRWVDESVPFLGHPVQIPHLPLNLRLASRIADYGTALPESSEETDDRFLEFIRNYTFLPGDTGDDLWLTVIPGMGPVPSWALHMLPIGLTDEQLAELPEWLQPVAKMTVAARDFLEAADQTFTFDDRWVDPTDWTGSLMDLIEFVVPDGRLTMRRVAERALEAGFTLPPLWGLVGVDPLNPSEGTFGTPPGFHNIYRRLIAQALVDNPQMSKGTDWERLVAETAMEAYKQAVRGAFFDTAGDIFSISGFDYDHDDGHYLDLYEGFISDLDWAWQQGFVGNPQRDEIMDLWPKLGDRTITYDESLRLGDRLSDVLFSLPEDVQDYMLVRHPELAANLTSQWKCGPGAPADACRGDRLVVAPGEDGRELREQGRRERWLVRRDPLEMAADTWSRYAGAVRRLRNGIWEDATDTKTLREPGRETAGQRVALSPKNLAVLKELGAEVPDGWRPTRRELYDLLSEERFSLQSHVREFNTRSTDQDLEAAGLPITALRNQSRQLMEKEGHDPDDTFTWPEAELQFFRDLYQRAIYEGVITTEDYRRELAGLYGSLDFEMPNPPPLGSDEIDTRIRVNELAWEVVDGDTLRLSWPDGEQRLIRLMGINAAEENTVNPEAQQAYADQINSLFDLLAGASQIDLITFDPERFRTTQETASGQVRFLMWLYVDGQPVWDPDSFSGLRPSGYKLGGEGI